MTARGLMPGSRVFRRWVDATGRPTLYADHRGVVKRLRGRGPSRSALVRWDQPILGEREHWMNLRLLVGADAKNCA